MQVGYHGNSVLTLIGYTVHVYWRGLSMSLNRQSCLMAAFNKYPDISYMHSHTNALSAYRG